MFRFQFCIPIGMGDLADEMLKCKACPRCPYLWRLTGRVRNKIARALFGNTNTVSNKPSWYQQHDLAQDHLSVCSSRIRSFDLIAVCGTHLQAHLEHSEGQQFSDSHRFWGPNPSAAQMAPPVSQISCEMSDLDFLSAVAAALPEEAVLRAQMQLLAAEWSVPVVPYQCLCKRNGVALVPKKALPSVLQQVGFATCSVGALLTENPDALGLRGNERTQVRCSVMVLGEANEQRVHNLQVACTIRFGEAVEQCMSGDQVATSDSTTLRVWISSASSSSILCGSAASGNGFQSQPVPASLVDRMTQQPLCVMLTTSTL